MYIYIYIYKSELIHWSNDILKLSNVADHHLYDIPQRHEKSLLPSPRNEPQQTNRERRPVESLMWNLLAQSCSVSCFFQKNERQLFWKLCFQTGSTAFLHLRRGTEPVPLLAFPRKQIQSVMAWCNPHTKIIEDRSGFPDWWPNYEKCQCRIVCM